jgi:dynein heavy chain
MYNYVVKPDIQQQVDVLSQSWEDLRDMSDRKDFELNEYKKNYSDVTKNDVAKFKEELVTVYEKYLERGPGSFNVSLEEGVHKLEESKVANEAYNRKREEFVLAEKLFNLTISKYPELIKMELDNAMYDEIYSIFKSHQSNVKEWSMMAWSKLDATQLSLGTEEKLKKVRKLSTKLPNAEHIYPFTKLRTTIEGFNGSLPLIQQLKIPSIQERHWKKIMEETGKDVGEINFKTMTLSKVFDLELQNYEEQVNGICLEAKEEAKNDDNLAKIETAWKVQNFEIGPYRKAGGGELKGYAIKSPDEIRQLLEDNILILQSLNASKYVRAIKAKVA